MDKQNWDIQEGFVSMPEIMFRTVRVVPLKIDHLKAGGFIEKAMWNHTRSMLNMFFLLKRNKEFKASRAYEKSVKALKNISTYMSQAGLPDLQKILLDHMVDEGEMGMEIIKGNKKAGNKRLNKLLSSHWFRNALWDANWSKMYDDVYVETLQMVMTKHIYSMYTCVNMLASTGSYSECKVLFEKPERVCLTFGMELGALLDQVVKVGMKKKEPTALKRSNVGKRYRSQSIEELDVFESELIELAESKALHEEWAAFRLEHRETIENRLSVEDYDWLEREIPQAVKPIGLRTPNQLWKRGKGDSLIAAEIRGNNEGIAAAKKRISEAKGRIDTLKGLVKSPKEKTRLGFLRGKTWSRTLPKKEREAAQVQVDQIKDRPNKINRLEKVKKFYTGIFNTLIKRNEALLKFWKSMNSKKKGAHLPKDFEWGEETIGNHLSEEYAWFAREIPQAIGLKKPSKLWKRGKNTSKLLVEEILRNNQRIAEARKDIESATKNIESHKKAIARSMEKHYYNEAELKEFMKILKMEGKKSHDRSIVTRKFIEYRMQEIKLEQKNVKIFRDIIRTLLERNKKLRAFIKSMPYSRKTRARLLMPQEPEEEETVIFW